MVKKKEELGKLHQPPARKIKIPVSGTTLFAIGLIVGLVLGLTFIGLTQPKQGLSPKEAGDKALNFISKNLLRPGITARVISVEEVPGQYLYKLSIEISSGQITQTTESYITKDGELLFPTGIPTGALVKTEEEPEEIEPTQLKVSKREKPEMKLFIMSHCPFGLQALKAYLPVYDLLKDKADLKIHFVSYIMHGKKEIDENLRMYCIQKEQEDKLYSYLSCFVKEGNYETCLEEANIDTNQLDSCIEETDKKFKITEMYNDRNTWSGGRFPQFNIDKDLNQKYGIRGSPTIVINGEVISITRSPEGFKEAICSAFITPPEECEQELSTALASPGFGTGTGNPSGGTCG